MMDKTYHSTARVPESYIKKMETSILARTIWGEARGEGIAGMEAVAAVVLNRWAVAREKGAFWWGSDIMRICQKPYQFSCWNKRDPNFVRVQNVGVEDVQFARALRIAAAAVEGGLKDQTGGATHYHASNILPEWAKGHAPTATIGRHVFYRII